MPAKPVKKPAKAAPKKRNRYKIPAKELEVLLPGDIRFRFTVTTYVSTGTNPKTKPGVGLDLHSIGRRPSIIEPGTDHRVCVGVLDRDQVRALYGLLGDFIADFPEES